MDELTGLSGGGRRGSMIQNSISAEQSSSPVLTNFPLISAFVAFALAQFIKVFTSWYKEKRWDLKQLVGSGGMPSSHSATVTALAAGIGFHDGFGGSLFAAALVLACVVMYDATGVRLQAGRQAEVLNQIVYELPAEHPLAESRPLRELLGHTPPQEEGPEKKSRTKEQKKLPSMRNYQKIYDIITQHIDTGIRLAYDKLHESLTNSHLFNFIKANTLQVIAGGLLGVVTATFVHLIRGLF